MSADNWRVCPKCKKALDIKRTESYRYADSMYGKVSIEQFQHLRRVADTEYSQWCNAAAEETLREDFEIRMSENGEFTVDYACSCKNCGFQFNYKHEEQVVK